MIQDSLIKSIDQVKTHDEFEFFPNAYSTICKGNKDSKDTEKIVEMLIRSITDLCYSRKGLLDYTLVNQVANQRTDIK